MSNTDQVPAEYSDRRIMFFILLAAIVLRIFAMCDLSLSNDELSALTRARQSNLENLITNGVYIDYHPAGVELFIYGWIKVFGDHPFWYRFPFAVFGVLSVLLIYLLGKRWFSENTGMLAATTYAVLQFPMMYSLYARPYSPGLLFCLIAAYAWTRIVFPQEGENKQGSTLKWWLTFILSMSACTHIHYFTFVFAAGVGLSGLYFIRKEIVLPYLLSGFLILLLFIPEWNIFLIQMKTGDIGGWLGAPGKGYFYKFVFYVFNNSWWLIIPICLGIMSGIFILLLNRKWNKFHSISLAWFFFSFFTAYGYSVLRHPVIQYSTILFVLPFLLFFIFSCISALTESGAGMKWLPGIFLILALSSTVFEKKLFAKSNYGVFKELAEDLKSWSEKYKTEKLPAVINVINEEYINYYFRKIDYRPVVLKYQAQSTDDLGMISSMMDTISANYMAFAWSNSSHLFEVNKLIEEHFPVLKEKNVYFNSATYLYAKQNSEIAPDRWISICDYECNYWGREDTLRSTEKVFHGSFSERLDSMREFSITYNQPLSAIPGNERSWITAKAKFYTNYILPDANLVMQFDRGDKTYGYFAQPIAPFNLHPGKWQEVIISRLLPEDFKSTDRIKIYFWNRDKKLIYIDNLSVEADKWEDPYLE